MPSSHALLAPSASKRWMTCTPSARLEAQYPSQDTVFTREGTIAHAVAENTLRYLLQEDFTSMPTLDEFANVVSGEQREALYGKLYNEALALELDWTDLYSTVFNYYVTPVYEDYLHMRTYDPEAQLLIEAELKLDEFIPESFGSSDAVLIYEDAYGAATVQVYDLKYGKGVRVSADHNPQMMCYALGACAGPAELSLVEHIKMTIIQPRLKHISTYSMAYDELISWARETLRPAAAMAFYGKGTFAPGEHCKFCRAAARCKALQLSATVTAEAYGQVAELTDEELATVLQSLPTIKDWITHVEAHALEHMLSGKTLPGFKVVEGRSLSKIVDTAKAQSILRKEGFSAELYMKEPELKSVTDLKKLLRPAGFTALLGGLLERVPGKPTIAPEEDSRPAYKQSAEDAFSNID